MPRLKLTLAYVGTRYHGWQIQAWKDRPHPVTVQAELEKALSSVVGAKVHVQGSGRTDSGVHAEGQVAHCDVPEHRARIDWRRALHTCLPPDIRVVAYELVPDGFDACFDATRKAYTYSLWLDQAFTPPRLYPFVWACGPLDWDKVDAAIPYLLGVHDFTSLRNSGADAKSGVRTMFAIIRDPAASPLPQASNLVLLRFEANGFLKQMARNITGLLVACGRGKFRPEAIPLMLEQKDRKCGPVTAPPQGLCLTRVWY